MPFLIWNLSFVLSAALGFSAIGLEPAETLSRLSAPEDLQSLVNKLVETHRLPGVSVAVIQEDIVLQASAGVRKWDSDHPFEIADKVHLGSCTKAVTATLAAVLVEHRRISWEDKLVEIMPELNGKIDEGFYDITLKQLLQHTSGVPANAKSWWLNKGVASFENRLAIAMDSLQKPPSRQGKFLYSNLGYMLAGLMLEKQTGSSWEALVQEHIFDRLEMTSAGFGPPGTGGSLEQPWGHQLQNNKVISSQVDNAPALGPAGTIHCSVADWATFIQCHMRLTEDEKALVSSATLDELHRVADGSHYSMGWGVTRRGDTIVGLNHAGSNTFWYSVVEINPPAKLAIIFSANIAPATATPAWEEFRSAILEPQ